MTYIKYNKIKYMNEEKRIEKDETKDKHVAQNSFNIILSTCRKWGANLTLRFLHVD